MWPARASDHTAELEKLAKLRDKGVITAEDFEAKKNSYWVFDARLSAWSGFSSVLEGSGTC